MNNSVGGPSHPFPFDDMGNSYLQKVREEANRMIAQARADAAKIKSDAADAGKRDAEKTVETRVQSKVSEQLKTLHPALDQAVKKLTEARLAWQKHWEEHALKTALAMAKRIVRSELSQRPEISLQWIREALELAAGSEHVTLRLNPADIQSLSAGIDEMKARLGQASRCQIVADPDVSAGGCLVETEFGAIDQQLETQLARLEQELLPG